MGILFGIYFNLITEKEEFNKYMQYCNKKKRRLKPNMGPIFYILRDCFGAKKHPNC